MYALDLNLASVTAITVFLFIVIYGSLNFIITAFNWRANLYSTVYVSLSFSLSAC